MMRVFALFFVVIFSANANFFDPNGNEIFDDVNSTKQIINWEFASENLEPGLKNVGVLFGSKTKFQPGEQFCSATLIDPLDDDSSLSEENRKTRPAYILTAGHCVGKLNETNQNIIERKGATAYFSSRFYKGQDDDDVDVFSINSAPYASNNFHDIAILRAELPLSKFIELGYKPLKLKKAKVGEKVQLIAAPIAFDYNGKRVELKDAYLRRSHCSLEFYYDEFKEGTREKASHFLANRCSTGYGSSGGAFISESDQKISAIVSTSPLTKDLFKDKKLPAFHRKINGAQPVDLIIGCFDSNGIWNPDLKSCHIERECDVEGSTRSCKSHYLEQCQMDQGWACHLLSFKMGLLKDGNSLAKNLLLKSCILGDSGGCTDYAMFLQSNDISEFSLQSFPFFDYACKLGSDSACSAVGTAKYNGTGTTEEYNEAFYQGVKGCKTGHVYSCYQIGSQYSWKPNQYKYRDSALAFACEQKFNNSCEILKFLKANPDKGFFPTKGLPIDWKKQVKIWREIKGTLE